MRKRKKLSCKIRREFVHEWAAQSVDGYFLLLLLLVSLLPIRFHAGKKRRKCLEKIIFRILPSFWRGAWNSGGSEVRNDESVINARIRWLSCPKCSLQLLLELFSFQVISRPASDGRICVAWMLTAPRQSDHYSRWMLSIIRCCTVIFSQIHLAQSLTNHWILMALIFEIIRTTFHSSITASQPVHMAIIYVDKI